MSTKMNKLLLLTLAMAVIALIVPSANATPEQDTINALTALKNHILGTPALTGPEIASHKSTIDSNKSLFGSSSGVMAAGFDFVDTYDTQIGPLFVLGSPIQTIDRNTITDSDIEWSVWNVMQYIMDYTYTVSNVATYETLLDGKLFGSSAHFPGWVDPAAQRVTNYSININADYPDTVGWPRFHEGPGYFSRKPTGTYVAPGDIATVTVPGSMVNQGYRIRVGCHSWDFSVKNPIRRLDRVTLIYDITSATTKVANPLGGGIYIEVPFDTAGSVETVQITNAVRSPFFSVNSITGNNTTVADWQNIERNHPAPWADFQTQKYMMNVPKDWIYALDTPDVLMAGWDLAADLNNELMGFPYIQGRECFYLQVDLSLRGGAYYPGWPQCNVSYNPNTSYGGLANNTLVKGPQFASSYLFHEEGHGYLFPKFPGETESVVNVAHVAIWHQGFGYNLDYAFAASRDQQSNSYRTINNAGVVWMTSFNFVNGNEMSQLEKQYQLPGHAKFANIARMFGWQVLNDYFKSFVDYYEATGIAKPFDNDTDEHILRLCIAADCDLRSFIYFWGIHPDNPSSLAADIAAANLTNSTADRNTIYDEIYSFSRLVPENNAEFQAFASSWWGRVPQLDATDQAEREHAQQWDSYDESSHAAIVAVINSILATYFPGGDPIPDVTPPTPNPATFDVLPTTVSGLAISMTATTGTDDSGLVEYYFNETTGNPGGTDSGWVTNPVYTDTGLNPGTQYTYTVQMRDASLNTGGVSAPASAATPMPVTVPNNDFETIYKPGQTTITAYLSGVGGTGSGWTQGVGPLCPIDSGQYNFSDETTGTIADIPGWVGYDRDGWIALGGTYGRDQTTGNLQGSVSTGNNHTPSGVHCYLANGGGWGNPAGGLIVSDASLGTIQSDATYVLSMYANGSATPIVLKLLADGVEVTPTSSVDPTLSSTHQEFSRTYDVADLTGYVGQDITIVCGLGRNAVGNQSHVDDVSLEYYPYVPVDTDPPTPNPATFASAPAAVSATEITMTATTGSDATGPVEYYFDETSGNPGGTDSGWTTNPVYNDTGLTASTQYTYTVQMRDSVTPTPNVGTASSPANATTQGLQFVAAGAVKSGTGSISPALPSGIAVNDILLLFVETANQAVSISNQNGGTWAAVTNSPQGTGTAGGTTATRLTVFWSRYNGTQGNPTVSDSGNHQLARMVAVRGAVTSGNPWDVTAGGVEATSDTSASIPGATTTVANTLVVVVTAGSLPDASGTSQFSAWTNANLTSLTERTDNSVNSGNGGSLGIATGIKATAGAYGNTAATHANSAVKGMISIAIKP
jgi:hypothetical protein